MHTLKNILLTAALVIGATMAGAGVTAIASLIIASREATTPIDSNLLVYGAPVATIMAMLVGLFFSFSTLFVAALTLPPSIGLMRLFKLPRPLFDILGAAAAGLLCTGIAAGFLNELARAKGGGSIEGDMRLVLDICAMLTGAILGYVRYALLVRPKASRATPPDDGAPVEVQAAG